MHLYESQYRSLRFEREGLFKAVQEKFRSREVLYPGCSVHITPSLYFPHIVYVDQSESAAEFFANEEAILEFVNRHKYYKQSAYLRFIRRDYSRSLALQDERFDLLLALFAGGITRYCYKYLKIGGYVLTNNHQGDAQQALQCADLKLTAKVFYQKRAYAISEDVTAQEISHSKSQDKYLKQGDQGIAFVENEIYYMFRRIH
jgi:hypothetical protein